MADSNVLAVAPFNDWTYDDALKAARDVVPGNYDQLKAYALDKDHFRAGEEWVGPGTATINEKIAKQFTPDDVIGEVLSNISNAFSEPQVGGAPVSETSDGTRIPATVQARINEATALLAGWWDRQKLHEHLQERQRTMAWAGYAGLRAWIPWRFLIKGADGSVQVKPPQNLAEALSYIHIMAPSPKHGMVVVDSGTQEKVAIFLDEEVIYRNGERKTYPRAELIYLDPDRATDEEADTVMRIVYANNDRPEVSARLPLKGRLLFAEMRSETVVTDPVIRSQRQLNLMTSLITRLGETAAFRERYTKNAKPQGIRIPYEEGDKLSDGAFIERDDEGRQWQVIPQPRTLGANTTTELIGLPKYDDRGDAKGNEMPGIEVIEPVDPSPYVNVTDAIRRRILRMCSQGHLGSSSNMELSGIAYEQARAVFEKDLNKRRVAQEGALRDLLTTVLTMAEHIAGQPGYFTDTIRITVDQHVNAGPRSPDMVRLEVESYEGGLLSKETAMARIGVEDIEAEMMRIRTSPNGILATLEAATKLMETYTPESVLAMLKVLDVPEEVLDALEIPEPEPVPATLENAEEPPLPEEE